METPRLKACCCGCDFKSGSLVVAWLNLICSSGILCHVFIEEAINGNFNIPHIVNLNVFPFLICLFGTVMSIILMIGIYKEKINFLKVWIVITSLATCVGLISCTLVAFNIISGAPDNLTMVGCILLASGIFYSLYIIYTVFIVHNFTRDLYEENEKDIPIITVKTISNISK